MERAYEYRIYPNARQRELIERTFGCCRWVFNKCLETREGQYAAGSKSSSCYELQKMVASWKKSPETSWLAEVDSHALQQAVVNLDRAYKNFFRRVKAGGKPGFPRFKSKAESRQSYRTNWGISVSGPQHIKLPKLGLVKARLSRMPEGRVLNATVKRTPTGKYLCVLCCTDCPQPYMPAGDVELLGVDAGIRYLMVRSDGKVAENPKALARSEKKLAREQRRLSRKQKGSRRRAKQKARVARVHEKAVNQRRDAIHKATTKAVRETQAIAAEDLNVKGMSRNHRIAKSVADASMSEMLRQLEYKSAWYGREFVRIWRWSASSKTCSVCGHVEPSVVLGVESWDCPSCGVHHDRDLNAARNIAAEGARLLAERDGTAGHAGTGAASAA